MKEKKIDNINNVNIINKTNEIKNKYSIHIIRYCFNCN